MKWLPISLIGVGVLCGCNSEPFNRYYQSACNDNKVEFFNTYDYYNYTYYGTNGERFVPERFVGDPRAGKCNGGQCHRRGDIF